MRLLLLAPLLLLVSCGKSQPAASPPAAPSPIAQIPPNQALVWDPVSPSHVVIPGEVAGRFTFTVKNISSSDVTITEVQPSCDCTTAAMPSDPWIIKPHETNKLEAVMDLRDEIAPVPHPGVLYREITIYGTNFTNVLKFSVAIPPTFTNTLSEDEMMRRWGQQITSVDHQAPFKNNCVKCHFLPAYGKSGEYLFHTACGICHEAKERASMVPDLSALKGEIGTNYWRNWVTYGKSGTLMPGFASTEGGPLDDAQIVGLVDYLSKAFPRPIKDIGTNFAK